MINNTKVWYLSLTVWFNVALALIAFIQSLSGIIPIPNNIIEAIALIGNILLRFKTNTGLVSAQPQE